MAQPKNATMPRESEDGWAVVSEESAVKIEFDEVGDRFTGIKAGQRTVEFTEKRTGEDKTFVVYAFRSIGMTDLGLDDETLCDIQESFKLKPLAEIPDGSMVRITRMKDVDVDQPSPMKDYRIEVKKS